MVRIEVFSSGGLCEGCVKILLLADRIAEKYKGKVLVTRYIGDEAKEKMAEYKIQCFPAIVIKGKYKIEGVCPDDLSIENLFVELGL